MSIQKEEKKDHKEDVKKEEANRKMYCSPCETIVEAYLVTNGSELNLISYHRSWKLGYDEKKAKDTDTNDKEGTRMKGHGKDQGDDGGPAD